MSRVANMFNNTEIKSIKAVRQIEELQHVPFYYPVNEELRIELVYEAGRRILPWDVKSDTTLLNTLPICWFPVNLQRRFFLLRCRRK